jgi:uracil-DNA glycosylase family 4
MPTRFQLHVTQWKDCKRCDLHKTRNHVVLIRGTIPADIILVGEAPGVCLAGETLIETAFRNKVEYPHGIPIKDLVGKRDFQVYSMDLDSKRLVLGTVNKVWMTSVRQVYRVDFFWWGAKTDGSGGRQKYTGSIRVTANHPFLLKSGQYRSIKDGLTVGDRLQPFIRMKASYHQVGLTASKKKKQMKRESRFLMENILGRPLIDGEEIHHKDRNKWNDTRDNLELIDHKEHARLHGLEDNVMFKEEHRQAHREALDSEEYRTKLSGSMQRYFSDPENRRKRAEQNKRVSGKTSDTLLEKYKDPVFYYKYLVSRVLRDGRKLSQEEIEANFKRKFPGVEFPPEDNHVISSITPDGVVPVYDMEVERYHNFVANGVFVHNSEDAIGKPFIGPAGHRMQWIIERAIPRDPDGQMKYTYALINLLACIPRDPMSYAKVERPPEESVKACAPRVQEIIELCNPRLIVCVGNEAQDWLDEKWKASIKLHRQCLQCRRPVKTVGHSLACPVGHVMDKGRPIPQGMITHPAYILRQSIAQQGLMFQRCVVRLQNLIEDMEEAEEKLYGKPVARTVPSG